LIETLLILKIDWRILTDEILLIRIGCDELLI